MNEPERSNYSVTPLLTVIFGLAAFGACSSQGPIRRLASEDPVIRTSQVPRESILEAPVSQRYLADDGGLTFRDSEFGYTTVENETGALIGFKFVSDVKETSGRGPASSARVREYNFDFPGRARQDLSIRVAEFVDASSAANRTESYLLVFPRLVVPTIRSVGKNESWVVTLPNREEFTLDAYKREIQSGVFYEAKDRSSRKKANREWTNIRYSGSGVLVRADAKGQDPRSSGMATISKGRSTCFVPVEALWDGKSAYQFRFASDEAFDRFLKRTCGFNLERTGSQDGVDALSARAPASDKDKKKTQEVGADVPKKEEDVPQTLEGKDTPPLTEDGRGSYHEEPIGGQGM